MWATVLQNFGQITEVLETKICHLVFSSLQVEIQSPCSLIPRFCNWLCHVIFCPHKTSVLNLSVLQFARSTWLTHFIIQYFMCLYVSSFTLIYHVRLLYFPLGLSVCLIYYYIELLFIISPASLALLPPCHST